MGKSGISQSTHRHYGLILSGLLLLFCLRVLGQLLVVLFSPPFLPPMQEWMSGAMPYPALLTSQLLIILLFGKTCLDLLHGKGAALTVRPRLAKFLTVFGYLYLLTMIIRYSTHMGLYSHERWLGGSIPVVFHMVLATFVLTYARYQRALIASLPQQALPAASARRHLFSKLWRVSVGLLIALGLSLWIAYQVAPSVIASQLGFRPAQYAVREEQHATMITSDGIHLVADIYHPQHVAKTPTILVRIPLTASFKNCLIVNLVARMWAERGYTVVIQGTRGRQQIFHGGRYQSRLILPIIPERFPEK